MRDAVRKLAFLRCAVARTRPICRLVRHRATAVFDTAAAESARTDLRHCAHLLRRVVHCHWHPERRVNMHAEVCRCADVRRRTRLADLRVATACELAGALQSRDGPCRRRGPCTLAARQKQWNARKMTTDTSRQTTRRDTHNVAGQRSMLSAPYRAHAQGQAARGPHCT